MVGNKMIHLGHFELDSESIRSIATRFSVSPTSSDWISKEPLISPQGRNSLLITPLFFDSSFLLAQNDKPMVVLLSVVKHEHSEVRNAVEESAQKRR